ncbi:MAG TPA: hypothetical protein VLC54_16750 [Anaeromyxobacter sp.]|nr:hypothetical protein [Anaeromyxobacter sp.]
MSPKVERSPLPHSYRSFWSLLLLCPLAVSSAVAAPASDACSIVTKADVEAALGKPVGAGEPMKGPSADISTCDYRTSDGSASVKVRLSPKLGASEHAAFPFKDPRPVPGLGEDAKFAPNAATDEDTARFDLGSALSVRKGKAAISIFYMGGGDRLAISRAIAEKALARL